MASKREARSLKRIRIYSVLWIGAFFIWSGYSAAQKDALGTFLSGSIYGVVFVMNLGIYALSRRREQELKDARGD